MDSTDIAIIGAGAAGLSVAAISAALGLRVVLVERGPMGGDCLNFGCVPSKALLAAAHAAQSARGAGRFGIRTGDVSVDWAAVQAHVRGVIAAIAPNDSAERFRAMGVDVIRASAHFVAPDEIEAGTRRIRFRRCVIAAGSSAIVPKLPGLSGLPFLTNESLFDLKDAPAHLLILGGGPIGIEMAQAHARLGCAVTLIEAAPSIASREDREAVDALRRVLRRDGVTIIEGAAAIAAEAAPEGIALRLADGTRIAGSHLLLALGRAPRLASLDLVAGGIEATAQGIATGADLRSPSNRRIWAAGDIADPAGIGPRAFTHVASQHASVIVKSMLFRLPTGLSYAALPRVTYCDPELAQIGLTEVEARAAGTCAETVRWPLAENDRAVAEGVEAGIVKLVLDRKARLLGATVLAPGAGDWAGMFGLMIDRRLPLSALAGLVVPYPTLPEAAKRAAGQYYTPKLLKPLVKAAVRWLMRLP
ncbi:dihydrolipoyl dehydrogenase family protein [Humitalea sp. 24SJ18S-53]|uniref:dihydrolipoyl dehydrogenase family protein n=1 Tax=Humitalea sp. 24SJ18S-53 TaxID=3422307 RepID=UPI003D67CD50